MTQWEGLATDHPNLKPWTDISLKWATKYYRRMDDTRAYIIAMCEFLVVWMIRTFAQGKFSSQSLHSVHLDRTGVGQKICHTRKKSYFGHGRSTFCDTRQYIIIHSV